MNICHVITRLIIGGAQENTVLTCRGLAERGHRVTLVAGPETGPEGSLWSLAEKTGCELVKLDSMRRAVRPMRDWKARCDLAKLFSKIAPDVVHTHSSKAGVLGRSAAAASRVPIVVHTIHGMSFNRTQPQLIQSLYRFLERRYARVSDRIVTVADAMIDQAVEAGLASRDRFVTVRSGMETDRFSPSSELRARYRKKWGVDEEAVVVGTVARLFENKGYAEIMKAMPAAVEANPRLRFVWIGDGPHRSLYESRLNDMGLHDRVHFSGLVEPDEVARQLNGFDIILHASRWEGLPRAIVQGLLTGIPAISFDNDGAPEVVVSDETGVLVPLGDTVRLSRAVIELSRDAERRCRLGQNGRARCLVEFDWQRMVDDLITLYDELAAGRGPQV